MIGSDKSQFADNGYDVLIAADNPAHLAHARASKMKHKDGPAVVAKAAYDALMDDRHKVHPTLRTKVAGAVADLSPAQLGAEIRRAFFEPGSGKE